MIVVMFLQPLSDAYGLLMHTNGQWEWTLAPGVSPSPRYQHAAVSYYLYHMCKFFVQKKVQTQLLVLYMTIPCPADLHNLLMIEPVQLRNVSIRS